MRRVPALRAQTFRVRTFRVPAFRARAFQVRVYRVPDFQVHAFRVRIPRLLSALLSMSGCYKHMRMVVRALRVALRRCGLYMRDTGSQSVADAVVSRKCLYLCIIKNIRCAPYGSARRIAVFCNVVYPVSRMRKDSRMSRASAQTAAAAFISAHRKRAGLCMNV